MHLFDEETEIARYYRSRFPQVPSASRSCRDNPKSRPGHYQIPEQVSGYPSSCLQAVTLRILAEAVVVRR